jgi:hypothetical protein
MLPRPRVPFPSNVAVAVATYGLGRETRRRCIFATKNYHRGERGLRCLTSILGQLDCASCAQGVSQHHQHLGTGPERPGTNDRFTAGLLIAQMNISLFPLITSRVPSDPVSSYSQIVEPKTPVYIGHWHVEQSLHVVQPEALRRAAIYGHSGHLHVQPCTVVVNALTAKLQ